MKLKIIGLKCFILLVVYLFWITKIVYAFEPGFPKLLWEKDLSIVIDEIVMADGTGDVLLSNKFSDQLILIDSQGYERLHLGPNTDGMIGLLKNINISTDGSKIMYQDPENNPVRESEGSALRLHFMRRNGEEIWKKDVIEYPILSPIADWYVLSEGIYYGYETPYIKAYDSSGNILWETTNVTGEIFSLDNGYLIAGNNLGIGSSMDEEDRIIRTYSRQGELVWEGKFKSNRFGFLGISEITAGGYLVWHYKDYHKIYDYLGNVVTDIPLNVNKTFISPDGKAVLFQYESTFQILNLPDKSLKMEGNLNFIEAKLSNEGKYLVGIRKPTDDIPENIVVYDIENKLIWKIRYDSVSNDRIEDRRTLEEKCIFTRLTPNGKYLVIIKKGRNHLYYYQIF